MSNTENYNRETSEYRGHDTVKNNQGPENTSNLPTQKPSQSYASATMNVIFPSKEQAIIVDSIEGTPIKDYACTIGKIIDPNAIRFISRISNGRICIYLDKKETVQSLTSNYKTIMINNTQVQIRPLVMSSQRIILSNVSPTIPHESIEEILIQNNIRLTSKLTFLRAGIQEPGFSHVLSFRRQVYVNPEDVKKIPDSFTILHDDTQYRIFASTDKVSCFLCKQEGHIASRCSKTGKSVQESNVTEPTKPSAVAGKQVTINNTDTKSSTMEIECPSNVHKRPLSSTTGSKSDIDPDSEILKTSNPNTGHANCQNDTTRTTQRKKHKRSQSLITAIEKIDEMLQPAKAALDDAKNKFILNYDQFKSLLENTFGVEYPADIAKEYTTDLNALNYMIYEIYPLCKDRSIKNRLHRLSTKLKNSLTEPLLNNNKSSMTEPSTNWDSGTDSDNTY